MKNEWESEIKMISNIILNVFKKMNNINIDQHALYKSSFKNKELKSKIDIIIEDYIISEIFGFGYPIISEEKGVIGNINDDDYYWIIDPLDGTVNFLRNLELCAVSIALWKNNYPIFGVIGEFTNFKLTWGSVGFGSYTDDIPINVSKTTNKSSSILCTGFPSRLELNEENNNEYLKYFYEYSKIRMFGSASMSLLYVAKGYADAYFEKDIMIWDVAAGIAIVSGAGGNVVFTEGSFENAINVYATNNIIEF